MECRLAKEYIESGADDEIDSTTAGGCTHGQVCNIFFGGYCWDSKFY